MSYREHFETFEHCGLTFAAYLAADDSMGAPWDEHDGHGAVRTATGTNYANARPTKKPGERFLTWERGWGLAYDWQGAMKKARAEGWGICVNRRAEWEARIGRKLTAGQLAEAAVKDDFERMRAFANDEWSWVGVIVELQDADGDGTDEEESLWGIESDSTDYHGEVARELADQLIDRLNLKDKRHKNIKRESAARSEVIRVRA